MPPADGTECDVAPVFLPRRPITQADLATLNERMRRRIVRWFKRRRFLDAHAIADMLAWENRGFSIDASVRIALFRLQLRVYCQPLDHLLRYCARPPFALERLSVARDASGRAEHWQARRGHDRRACSRRAVAQRPLRFTRHKTSPARTIPQGLPGRHCWRGWGRSFQSSAWGAAAIFG